MTDETTAQAGAGMEWAAHEARPPLATRQTADAGTLVGGEAAAENTTGERARAVRRPASTREYKSRSTICRRSAPARTIAAGTVHAEFDEPMIELPGEWDSDSRLYLKASSPRPCTVAAAVIGIQTHG